MHALTFSFYNTSKFHFPQISTAMSISNDEPLTPNTDRFCMFPNPIPWYLENVQTSWSFVLDGGRSRFITRSSCKEIFFEKRVGVYQKASVRQWEWWESCVQFGWGFLSRVGNTYLEVLILPCRCRSICRLSGLIAVQQCSLVMMIVQQKFTDKWIKKLFSWHIFLHVSMLQQNYAVFPSLHLWCGVFWRSSLLNCTRDEC